jgi:hypothetical protein
VSSKPHATVPRTKNPRRAFCGTSGRRYRRDHCVLSHPIESLTIAAHTWAAVMLSSSFLKVSAPMLLPP